ncbi:DUF2357 domain-containing protein [Fervidibacter sacchari]|uniref:Component of viral defense system (DUF524 family) n=1 Tax=Candidatus Fervidibacter sacchari TaxID=1448929 RepID=A0ABT2ERM8_9BACT|nr:DUF2357 domain-containing protein [Candidatus Fervidibacter sacchari]MCS3920628.1 putative component of viral defense system (DUF524 family) [Candidatus Fervidibacter sacchari]WKU16395.1 DUF2357 domain-containing protein [Candidatus Fervidibacter sacchari]
MGKWQKCENCDDAVCWCWTDGEIKVTLKLTESKRQQDEQERQKQDEACLKIVDLSLKDLCREHGVDIADAIVPEWKELWGQVEPEAECIWFGEQEASKKPNGWWSFTFRNYLGKSVIRIKLADGREVVTDPIEVVSPKTPLDEQCDPLFYPKFLRTLIDDLIRYLVSLPFDWAAPTEFTTEERTQPPSPIFVLHVLAQHADTICYALQTIWRNPHRRLVTEERWVLLSEASSVDADTILMMLHYPEHLRPYRGNSLSTLAQRLKSKVPERVFERRVTETLDTPENRFIKRFMDIVLYWCDELKRLVYWEKAKSHQPNLEDLQNFVRFLRADPLFADVSELTIFPASSQVLQKRDGYRECLQIYRLLHIARAPIFDRLQDAIDNRRIDQLYEFWCFFRLAEELKCKSVSISERDGSFHFEAELPDGRKLIHNKCFGRGSGDGCSYSVRLRPDFSVMNGNKPEVVFDAKFRFDDDDVKKLKEMSEAGEAKASETIDAEMDDAQQKGDVERLAKHADICKMHTYRDALKCRAAVILFPGTKGVFYRIDGTKEDNPCLSNIVRNNGWEGVGAVPFVPKPKGEPQS